MKVGAVMIRALITTLPPFTKDMLIGGPELTRTATVDVRPRRRDHQPEHPDHDQCCNQFHLTVSPSSVKSPLGDFF
jgi:hypothetical protein